VTAARGVAGPAADEAAGTSVPLTRRQYELLRDEIDNALMSCDAEDEAGLDDLRAGLGPRRWRLAPGLLGPAVLYLSGIVAVTESGDLRRSYLCVLRRVEAARDGHGGRP